MGVFQQPVRPFSLNPGVGVAEDDPTVSAGLDQVTAPRTLPSLCHEGVAGIDHPGQSGLELLESSNISITGLV